MKDGMIKVDSDYGKELGFTSDKWSFSGSWLWKKGDKIYFSMMTGLKQGQGNLSKLMNECWKRGYTIKVPTPFAKMEAILIKKGFEKTKEYDEKFEDYCEVWIKKPDGRGGLTESPVRDSSSSSTNNKKKV